MRRLPLIGVPALAALGVGTVTAVTTTAQSPGGETLELVTRNFTFKLVDAPPRARSEEFGRGDSFMIAAKVYDRADKRQGRFDAVCHVTLGGQRGRAVCEAVWDLRDGELHAMARLGMEDDVSGSIVGGTGAYAVHRRRSRRRGRRRPERRHHHAAAVS